MATVDELTRDIIASIATDSGAPAVWKWVDNRYKEMVARVKFRHLRQLGELSLPAPIDSGTITVTRGSTAVVGVGTTFETEISSGDQEYYYFRAQSAWYQIASITDETNLVLESEFAEDDISEGSYKIVKRHHPLISNARWVGDFYHTRLRESLALIDYDSLSLMFPGRTLVGNIPTHVAQVGTDSSNNLIYEIYPPPEESEIIHYIYWNLPSTLTANSTIPAVIDPYTLKEGVLIDLYRYEKAAARRNLQIEAANSWSNDEARQRTIWKKVIKDAIRTSRGSDDITFILTMFRTSQGRRRDQRTAHDYVFDNYRSL